MTSVVRDREYDVTQGTPDSRIVYFTANPNGEAEIIKVTLKPNPRIRRIIFEEDFSQINIKGRQAMGNILTRNPVHKIALSSAAVPHWADGKYGSTKMSCASTTTAAENTSVSSKATSKS